MVSARRVLAIAGAMLSLGGLLAFMPVVAEEAGPGWLVPMALGAAGALAAPFLTEARWFWKFAGGVAVYLTGTGFLLLVPGVVLLWPGAALLTAAGSWRPDSDWRLVVVVPLALLALVLLALAVALVIVILEGANDN